jgi:serine/threonine-protein kinase RsbW
MGNEGSVTAEFRARFACTYRSAVEARRQLVAFIRTLSFEPESVADIESAVGEALANAAEHGFNDGTAFEIRAWIDGESLAIEVQDQGPGFPQAGGAHVAGGPPADAPRGFGIFIMRTLMDEIAYDDRGRRITLRKRLPVVDEQDATAFG